MTRRHSSRASARRRPIRRRADARCSRGFVNGLLCAGASALVVGVLALQCAALADPPKALALLEVPKAHVTPWAARLEGGTIRALFVVPARGAADVVHLVRRLDLDAETVVFDLPDADSDSGDSPQLLAQDALDRLDRLLRASFDVIVLAQIEPDAFAEPLRARLIERLSAGAGLVHVAYAAGRAASLEAAVDGLEPNASPGWIASGIGKPLLAGWKDGLDSVRRYEGPGRRVCAISYWTNAPQTHCLIPASQADAMHAPTTMNNYLSLVARALRWAAGRDPSLHIERLRSLSPSGPEAIDTPPQLPKAFVQRMLDAAVPQFLQPYELQFGAPAPRKYQVKVQARYPYRNIQWTYMVEDEIGRGDRSALLNVPAGFGDFFLDVWLLDGEKVVDWYTAAVHQDGWPAIRGVKFSAFAVDRNDRLGVSLDVRPHLQRPRPCTVFIRATDTLGRVVAEKRVAVGKDGGPVRAELRLVDLIGPYLKVEVFATDTPTTILVPWIKERAGYAFSHVLVRRGPRHGFGLVAESLAAAEFNARAGNRALARLGVHAVYAEPETDAPATVALDHLDLIPKVPGLDPARFGSPPESVARSNYALQEQAKRLRLFTDGLYMVARLDADWLRPDRWAREEAQTEAFRSFLHAKYERIDQLNEAWDVDLPDWSAVSLNNLPPSPSAWIDFRHFASETLADTVRNTRDVLRAADRRARVGLFVEPTLASTHYLDWASLASRVDALPVPMDPVLVAKARSYRSASSFMPIVYEAPPEAHPSARTRWAPWFAAINGLDGVWLANESADPLVTGTGEVEPWLLDLAREIERLQSGVAYLLRRARRAPAAIAIYDSASSAYLDEGLGAPFYSVPAAQSAAVQLLEDLGYGFDVVSRDDLVRGGLDAYTVLVLPCVRALDDEEAGALRAFHERGGALIADVLPGRYHAEGRAREAGSLNDVFGVSSTGPVDWSEEATLEVPEGSAFTERRAAERVTRADRAVRAAGAQSMASVNGQQVWLVHDDKKGVSLLLNHPLAGAAMRNTLERALDGWLAQAQRGAGGGRVARAGKRPFRGSTARFEYSKAKLVAILADPDAKKGKQKVRLPVEKTLHAYDALNGVHRGQVKEVTVALAPGEPALIALLPYEVSRLIVNVPEASARGRRLMIGIEVKTRGALPGDHVVHVTVEGPGGRSLRHYAKTVDCPDGSGATYIPLALNDRPGTYRIHVRDVLSGVSATADTKVF